MPGDAWRRMPDKRCKPSIVKSNGTKSDRRDFHSPATPRCISDASSSLLAKFKFFCIKSISFVYEDADELSAILRARAAKKHCLSGTLTAGNRKFLVLICLCSSLSNFVLSDQCLNRRAFSMASTVVNRSPSFSRNTRRVFADHRISSNSSIVFSYGDSLEERSLKGTRMWTAICQRRHSNIRFFYRIPRFRFAICHCIGEVVNANQRLC